MSELYLMHFGVKGQKWGVRRYQNPDGSYKKGAEGRYDPEQSSNNNQNPSKDSKEERKETKKSCKEAERRYNVVKKEQQKRYKNAMREYVDAKKAYESTIPKKEMTPEQKKKAVIVAGSAVAVAVIAAYGGYKMSQFLKDKSASIATRNAVEWYKNNSNGDVNRYASSVYKQARQNTKTKQALRETLNYLGTGSKLSDLKKASEYGYKNNSTLALAKRAVGAQTKRIASDTTKNIKNVGNATKQFLYNRN